MIRRPPRPPLFPPTTLSRSSQRDRHTQARGAQAEVAQIDGEDDPEKSVAEGPHGLRREDGQDIRLTKGDRKSTRLNSSHLVISYAVFCLKKKNQSVKVSVLS